MTITSPVARRPVGLAVATGLAVSLVLGLGPGASAAPDAGEARRQAASLLTEVQQLRLQAASATEDYDDAQAKLGELVTRQQLAARQLDEAKQRSNAYRAAKDQRIRALYMTGGELALFATVLDAESLSDISSRIFTVRSVLAADRSTLSQADDFTNEAGQIESDLEQLTAQQTALQARAAAAAATVQTVLDRQEAALAAANSRVRAIEKQLEDDAAAAAARRGALDLAAAIQAALDAGQEAGGPSPTAAAAIAAAATQIGKPYLWGATGPDSFDCSGLTGWAFRQVGVNLPRTSRQQWYAGTPVPLGLIRAGDLLFWANDVSNPATIHHVAIYLGNGQMLAAPHTGALVRVQPIYLDGYIGAVRPA